MRLHVDKEADALYLRLDDSKIIESDEVAPGIILDYNEQNEVVGIEMLYLSKRSPNLKASALEFEYATPESAPVVREKPDKPHGK
jgi:uncharacterized protein YuzE